MEKERTSQKPNEKDYWKTISRSDFIPNFFMTPEYVEKAGLVWTSQGPMSGWKEPDESGWFFPPLCSKGFFFDCEIWAGFADLPATPGFKFLDHQYIYDAQRFLDLSGGDWKVYRRNLRKYPKRNPGDLVYRRLDGDEHDDSIAEMLARWSEGKILQDPETMIRFFLYGKLRWGLFRDGQLIGLNVADENHLHAIFRNCLDDGTPFLNEYLRHCFYTSEWVQKRRWVNDGGDLGNAALAMFKRKLNPMYTQKIYSHSGR